jgi:hypothetical protein
VELLEHSHRIWLLLFGLGFFFRAHSSLFNEFLFRRLPRLEIHLDRPTLPSSGFDLSGFSQSDRNKSVVGLWQLRPPFDLSVTAQEQILKGGLFGSARIQQDEGAFAGLDCFQDTLGFRRVGHGLHSDIRSAARPVPTHLLRELLSRYFLVYLSSLRYAMLSFLRPGTAVKLPSRPLRTATGHEFPVVE